MTRNKKLYRGSKNWRSDEVKKRNLMWNFEEKSERNLKSWHQFTSAAAYYDTWKIICDILHGYTFSKSLHDFYNAWQSSSCIRFRFLCIDYIFRFYPEACENMLVRNEDILEHALRTEFVFFVLSLALSVCMTVRLTRIVIGYQSATQFNQRHQLWVINWEGKL